MIRNADEAEKFAVAGDVYALLATGEDTGGAYALVEAVVPTGGGPPPHTQADTELFYILSGEVTFTVEDKETIAKPGTHLRVEPGVVHAFRNNASSPARMLIQTMPAGLDAYFREVGEPWDDMNKPPPLPTPEHIAALKAAAPKYGINILV